MNYNDHLFGNKLSRFFHLSRFKWLRQSWQERGKNSENLLELGCFDGRSYENIERKPARYRGLDADWDGGLSSAREKFSDRAGVTFIEAGSLNNLICQEDFDSFICMETFEHIRPDQLPKYLDVVSQKLNGPAFITVPNEVGFFFFFKNIAKLITGSSRKYTVGDFWNHVRGRTWRVSNPKGGHKGFSYHYFLGALKAHMEIESVEGLPFRKAPLFLNSTIAIIAKPRK